VSNFEDTNPRDLKGFLDQIERRVAVLPDCQRDVPWDPHATRKPRAVSKRVRFGNASRKGGLE
jgi:hypothetical protein